MGDGPSESNMLVPLFHEFQVFTPWVKFTTWVTAHPMGYDEVSFTTWGNTPYHTVYTMLD